ncbi:MAG: VPLPA-CTERM sorting domain-containing protein [Pseudomonadota bacterium]
MLKAQLSALLLLFASGSMVSAATNTIDFEEFAPGTVLNGLNLGDLKLNTVGADIAVTTDNPGGTGNAIEKAPFAGPNRYMAKFKVSGVRNISVDVGDFGGDEDNSFLKAYDADGVLIAKQRLKIPANLDGMVTLSVSADVDIYKIKFGTQKSDQFPNSVYADNLTYDYTDMAAVPLPAGGLLLMTALAGLGLATRRRKST